MAGAGSNTFRKTFIMLWKNYLLRKRHYIQTALEIILPTLLFVILVAINSTTDAPYSQEGTNVVPANIPKVSYYPVDYCLSLTDMLEKETDEDDKTSEHLTVLARQIYYTNVPTGREKENVTPSLLVKDIMETVQKTINYFLIPCCTVLYRVVKSGVDWVRVGLYLGDLKYRALYGVKNIFFRIATMIIIIIVVVIV